MMNNEEEEEDVARRTEEYNGYERLQRREKKKKKKRILQMEFPFDINYVLPYEVTIYNGDYRVLNQGHSTRIS